MPKYHCVLDTSALLKRYREEDGTDVIEQLFDYKDCARHILNITGAEALGAFFRWKLSGTITGQKFKELKAIFKKDKETNKVIIHNVHQGNISSIHKIYDYSGLVPQPYYVDGDGNRKSKPRVGPVDVLILSVCQEINKSYGGLHLFTADEHMLGVADKMGIKAHNPEQLKSLPF